MGRRHASASEGTVRISAGDYRSRIIDCPDTGDVRPMLSRTRMAMFNLLADDIKDAVVWDCFAGSGLLGIEALSRGAKYCVFVERDPRHYRMIEANLMALKATDRSQTFLGSTFDLLRAGSPPLPNTPADIVLLDPPHAMMRDIDSSPFWDWLTTLHETCLIDGYTLLCIGHPANMDWPIEVAAFRTVITREYGSVAFSILARIDPPDEETE